MNSAPPILDQQTLLDLARSWTESWAKAPATLQALPSYDDLNAIVLGAEGERFVIKVSNPAHSQGVIEAETAIISHCRATGELPVVQVLRSSSGEQVLEVNDSKGRLCQARALSFMPGKLLARTIKSDPLLTDIGRVLGKLDRTLERLDLPATHRDSLWDLDRGVQAVEDHQSSLDSVEENRITNAVIEDHNHWVDPISSLPRSIIHGDANDGNLLVGHPSDQIRARANRFEASCVTGLIDFGDTVFTTTMNELAITVAYCLFDNGRRHATDPLALILPLVEAYHAQRPLSEDEVRVLFPKALLRLAVSATLGADARAKNPDNAYITTSQQDCWSVLRRYSANTNTAERRAALHRIEWRLRATCGFEPVPGAKQTRTALGEVPVMPVLAGTAPEYRLIDLSFETGSLVGNDPSDEAHVTRAVSRVLGYDVSPIPGPVTTGAAFSSPVGWGRYGEPRPVYVGDQFHRSEAGNTPEGGATLFECSPSQPGPSEPRTVHLGVDLFAPPGTPVHAPIDGNVHSFADNAIVNDYGPTILLEHHLGAPADGARVFTLYGHLSRESLLGLEVGQTISAGTQIGTLGTAEVNGGWTPHLHFQIMLDDLGLEGSYPGVGEASQFPVWEITCPDPNLLLRWNNKVTGPAQTERNELWARRRTALSPSLSLAYERPLHVTFGRAQFLYENNGHQYLDLVNNVSHVGHCHPRVVDALCQQAATLNTNSRYLHRNVVDFAERLLATIPRPRDTDPLEVCFLVNSGSEANDLALRMARNATSRKPLVCMDGAYHGHLTSTVEISPYKHDGPGGRGTPSHIHKVSMPDTYRGEHRGADAAEKYAEEVREIVQKHSVAAFVGEPILSCGGQIELPAGYLKRVYAAVRNQGGLCIADEVQVGFGRVGSHFWAFETQGVVPDIVTLGKPIGNGHPLAAVLTTRAIAESFANGMEYFNTYGGNPVSCAVGLAVLDVIEEEGLQQRAYDLGTQCKAQLLALAVKYPCIGDVRGRGLFLGFELVSDTAKRTPDPDLAWYLVQWMRERGILLSTDGPDHNVIKIKPPMVVQQRDLDRFIGELDRFLETVETAD